VALIAALPMGYLADIIGRKGSLVLSGALLSISILAMALWQSETSFYSMNVLSGIAQSLAGVTMSPFLMENSNEKERTYLFSFGQGLQMTMASVGNWIGGYLPTWMGNAKNVIATSSTAYGDSILIIGIGAALAIIPLVFLTSPKLDTQPTRHLCAVPIRGKESACCLQSSSCPCCSLHSARGWSCRS
jgi:MFS family permease